MLPDEKSVKRIRVCWDICACVGCHKQSQNTVFLERIHKNEFTFSTKKSAINCTFYVNFRCSYHFHCRNLNRTSSINVNQTFIDRLKVEIFFVVFSSPVGLMVWETRSERPNRKKAKCLAPTVMLPKALKVPWKWSMAIGYAAVLSKANVMCSIIPLEMKKKWKFPNQNP